METDGHEALAFLFHLKLENDESIDVFYNVVHY